MITKPRSLLGDCIEGESITINLIRRNERVLIKGYTKDLSLKAFFANVMLFYFFMFWIYTCALLFDGFNECSSSITEINRLINKGMSNIYYSDQLTFSKLSFSRKENLKKCTSFEEQKGTKYIRGNIYFGIIVFSCLSSTKPCLRFLLICFAREIKGFYQSSLGNKVDFTNIMNISPIILAKN